MDKFHEIFPSKHAVLPVVHVEDIEQVMRNVAVAHEAGSDGVFLISMRGASVEYLKKIYSEAKKHFGGFWIGLNDLTAPAVEVFVNLTSNFDGVWTDDARIKELFSEQLEAEQIKRAQAEKSFPGLYFGGVAFKYRERVADVEKAASIAAKYMDVVVTSGDRTGNAPEVGKIELMKRGVGDTPLAIASGISPENVHQYLNIADAFLVASSLLKPGTQDFDSARVNALVQAVRNFS